MSYEETKNETEILSADDQKLREICFSLKKIEAPKDFDFKLKARLAASQASDFQPRFGFALRYALPVVAVVFLLGLLAYSGGMFAPPNNQFVAEGSVLPPNPALPQNAAVSDAPAPEINTPPNESLAILPANQESPKVPKNELAIIKQKDPKKDVPELKREFNGGSKDFSSTADKPRQPKFYEQKIIPQPDEPVNSLPVRDVLSIMGITAAFENGKWTVRAVTANGLAEASGIRENDTIEAIDDEPLSGETVNVKTISGKTVTVTRNGGKSQIKLRNK